MYNISISLLTALLLSHQTITHTNKIRLIGVMSFPCSSDLPNFNKPRQNYNCISKSYVQWVGQTGAQPLLTPYDLDKKILTYLLDKMQGFLLSGGEGPIFDKENNPSTYMETISFIVDYAKKRNKRGRKFVLWGTSQGFVAMLHAISESKRSDLLKEMKKNKRIKKYSAESRKNNFHKVVELEKSAFWKNFNKSSISKILKEKNQKLPEILLRNPNLKKNTRRIKLEENHLKQKIDSEIFLEHKTMPFFGVQFHPEKTQFENLEEQSDGETVRVMREIAFQFVGQMREGVDWEKIESRVRPFMAQFHTAKKFGGKIQKRIYIFQNRKFNYCPNEIEERGRNESS